MTDQPDHLHEVDPRFPSGQWRGYYIQWGSRAPMELALEFKQGHISGHGSDRAGRFAMHGHYNVKTGKVVIRKHYIGQHMVPYTGAAGEDRHIRGQWELRSCGDAGPWHIWPHNADADAQADVVESVRVVRNWSDLEHLFKDLADV